MKDIIHWIHDKKMTAKMKMIVILVVMFLSCTTHFFGIVVELDNITQMQSTLESFWDEIIFHTKF